MNVLIVSCRMTLWQTVTPMMCSRYKNESLVLYVTVSILRMFEVLTATYHVPLSIPTAFFVEPYLGKISPRSENLSPFFFPKKNKKKNKILRSSVDSCHVTCVCVMNHLEDFRVNFVNLTDSLFF